MPRMSSQDAAGSDVTFGDLQLYADGADIETITRLREQEPRVKGFTTNPTLMYKAGVPDYLTFAEEAASAAAPLPISLEVLADDLELMGQQARRIAEIGTNVYVKVPVSLTDGTPTYDLVGELNADGVSVNVTAVTYLEQVEACLEVLAEPVPSIISIFAGRIADAGVDPVPLVTEAVQKASASVHVDILWASPRETYNVIQARQSGCQIITLTDAIWAKLGYIGRPLDLVSRDMVHMFHNDALVAGYTVEHVT
jgi:transaldolase